MSSGLPISLDDLIHARSVEDNRREFKASWNESTRDPLSAPSAPSPTTC